MKNWTRNFIDDMKHIWREFRRDIAETNAKKTSMMMWLALAIPLTGIMYLI